MIFSLRRRLAAVHMDNWNWVSPSTTLFKRNVAQTKKKPITVRIPILHFPSTIYSLERRAARKYSAARHFRFVCFQFVYRIIFHHQIKTNSQNLTMQETHSCRSRMHLLLEHCSNNVRHSTTAYGDSAIGLLLSASYM